MRIVTASIGVASLLSGTGLDAAGLMARADEALYMAKSAGRDRITGWRPGTAAQQAG
jgi:PleD family two-component response regulator